MRCRSQAGAGVSGGVRFSLRSRPPPMSMKVAEANWERSTDLSRVRRMVS